MKNKNYYLKFMLVVLSIFFVGEVFAQSAEFGKPIESEVMLNKSTNTLNTDLGFKANNNKKKKILLMNVPLSLETRKNLLNPHLLSDPIKNQLTFFAQKKKAIPAAHELGMNNVPVLDQGRHGSCATFATTAAVDTVLGKGDYISQLCNLELGEYLEKVGHSKIPSGWNGSYNVWVLDQMMRFGFVDKDSQHKGYCAGVLHYPAKNQRDEGQQVNTDDFYKYSHNLIDEVYYNELLSHEKRSNASFVDYNYARESLLRVKHAIADGNRVLFGTFVVLSPKCSVGACASYKKAYDTWSLSPELYGRYRVAGHAMVFTGYDDNAVVVDGLGNKHKGLLKIRNSWGSKAGDNGNYYMTYDYFVHYVLGAYEIGKVKKYSHK